MPRRLAAALLALATGCAAPASNLGTTPTLPSHFTLSGSHAIPDRWWMALPDPALHALVERALSGNLDLQIAWSRLAQVDLSRAALDQSVLAYQQAVLAAAAEVEDALVTEQQQRGYLASLDRQLALAEQTLAAARGRYTAGLADYLRVLEAEQSLQGLQKSRLSAEADLVANRIGLYRALAASWGLPRRGAT